MTEQPDYLAGAEEQIASFAPILELEIDESIICHVMAVRTVESQFGEGELVDCTTIGGTEFTLRGHAILCMKLKPVDTERFPLHIIRYCGKVGRAHDYYVAKLQGDAKTVAASKMGITEIERVEAAILQKISELPPKD